VGFKLDILEFLFIAHIIPKFGCRYGDLGFQGGTQ
jgi:hypothetical protein